MIGNQKKRKFWVKSGQVKCPHTSWKKIIWIKWVLNDSNGKNKTLCDSYRRVSQTIANNGSVRSNGDTFKRK